jgi:hypothetical protein
MQAESLRVVQPINLRSGEDPTADLDRRCALSRFGQMVQGDHGFPVQLMQRRAKSHYWTRDDFARLQRESLGLLTGSAPKAWDEYMIKHEARVKEWAYQEEEAA